MLGGRIRVATALAIAYAIGAIPVWIGFATSPPDGLANIGLVLYTFPVVAFGTFMLKLEFPYVGGGYYVAHSVYFVAAVVWLSAGIYLVPKLLREVKSPVPAAGED